MHTIDHTLIHEALKFTTGANVHLVRTWIFLYEKSEPGSAERQRYQRLLQTFVNTRRLGLAAKLRSTTARKFSDSLLEASDILDQRIENWRAKRCGLD